MSLKQLRQHLRTKEHNELIDEIADLYKKFDNVKAYYQASVFNDDSGVLKKFKKIIGAEFLPNSQYANPPCRISVAKKAIADYKKLSCSDENLADIMLFYVECGVQFTTEYGDVDDRFYSSMVSVYVSACSFIVKNNIRSVFQQRALKVVADTSMCGWGFHEDLDETYHDYFGDLEEG